MGRVKRYKRIKAIDPFSKTGGKVDFDLGKSYDLGPSKKDIEAIPRSIQMMLDKKAALAGEKPALRPDKPKNTSFFSHVKMLPGESMSAFHRRLNNERTKALASIRQEAKESKHISSKRKEYLDKKKEKKKLRGTGELEAGYAADAPDPLNEKGGLKNKRKRAQREQEGGGDLDDSDGEHAPSAKREKTMEFPSDRVTFGERAMEPPKLTVKPRKSQKQKAREAIRKAQKAAIAAGQASDASVAAQAAADAAQSALDAQRAAELKKAQMERYRAQVQAAYQQVKAKKRDGGGKEL